MKSIVFAILKLLVFAVVVGLIIFAILFIAVLLDINPTYIVIGLVILVMIVTATIILMSNGGNPHLNLANRYRYKGLWYGVATITSLVILIDNAFIITELVKLNFKMKVDFSIELILFHLILVYIVLIECLDNYKSYTIEKNKKKNSNHDKRKITVSYNKLKETKQVDHDTSKDEEKAYLENLINEREGINNDIRYLKNLFRFPMLIVIILITILSFKSVKDNDSN